MTQKEAENRGLVFEGCTAHNYDLKSIERLKQTAKKIKALGFETAIVQTTKNSWGNGCKMLYVTSGYHEYDRAKFTLERFEANKQAIIKDYNNRMQKLVEEQQKWLEIVNEISKKLKK